MTAALALPPPADAQIVSPLAGVWSLSRSSSELPGDIGFKMSLPTSGRGGRSAPTPSFPRPESFDDAQRVQVLTAEVRNPPVRLTVVDTPMAVTMTDERGQSRTVHPDGREESIAVQGVPIRVTSKREGDRLVVLYHVEQDRDLRYTYSSSANPSRLVVDVQFLERGAGDKAKRVYEPGAGIDTLTSAPAQATPAAASGQPAPQAFDQRPGAELKGLKTLGVVVEDLSAQAVACGLGRDAIESALSKRLADGGFVVRKNSDDDTYVYVNIITSSLPNGMCVSRYDAFLYTNTTAKLSYHDQPVLVQVSLIHRGGISGGAPSAHGTAVTSGLENYIDLFVTQIHDANK